ncbi:MAG TPA: hypothetical protein VIL97_09535 [Thermoanaerobaculia bacterium]
MGQRIRSGGEWLPSRFRYAAFRLVGFIRVSGILPEPNERDERVLLTNGPEQTRFETYTMMILVTLFWTLDFLEVIAPAPTMDEAIRRAPTALAAAILAFHAMLPVGSLVTMSLQAIGLGRGTTPLTMITRFHVSVLTLFSIWVATEPSVLRWSGIVWLAMLVVNALAATILWFLRGRVKAVEDRWREWVFDARF